MEKLILNIVYDLVANNDVGGLDRILITDLVDHVDMDRGAIVFTAQDGREYQLQLVGTYAPAPGARS
jgi:hypothetical protein